MVGQTDVATTCLREFCGPHFVFTAVVAIWRTDGFGCQLTRLPLLYTALVLLTWARRAAVLVPILALYDPVDHTRAFADALPPPFVTYLQRSPLECLANIRSRLTT
jgi:hypothetical protein